MTNEPNRNDNQQLVAALRDALKQRSNGSELGQKKFRGGTPPAPPAWKNSTDLRAFARWERKVEIWIQKKNQSYMTTSEPALSLFVSVTGEAELEVEHLDIKMVNGPLQQRTLFEKGPITRMLVGMVARRFVTVSMATSGSKKTLNRGNSIGSHV